ncbi:MarR family winged helix-turn-helix transcriptional regulator [Anaeromicrobium sediminis]|uniref:HTH marR-type domain-containing protein n=1 Tax=Anaeromicrobium sediminis TaxID=1478221 RepID=A0A267MLT3_9FIRM|nr:MarR family winged helix-turn-helix transcriptional regulator [Anaeromicrobium sediminis]PAB60387.1 hypothetical protein CCE28_05690 [Anaeromicrobium sediminis]
MENHSITMYLSTIERDYNYYINKKLKQYNLGKHDIRVLKVINANKGLSQNYICTILKEDKITVNKSVKNLILQGYVEKIKDCEDKRITRLYITEEGRVNRKKILNILKEVNDIFFRGFSEENKEKILELLREMSENIHKEVVRLKDEK